MITNKNNITDLNCSNQANTIGQLIKSKREQQKISIRQISTKTKIRQNLIIYLENDNLSKLPSRPYVIGFLKSITQALGIDYTYALELFDKTSREVLNTKSNQNNFDLQIKTPQRKLINTLFSLIALSSAIAVVFFVYVLSQKPIESNNLIPPLTTEKSKLLPAIAIKPDTRKDTIGITAPRIINLSIKATSGTCWIAFQTDKKPIVKYIMKKGKTILLTGEIIKLQLGNYKVVTIEKDNVPINIKNTRDTIAHLVFPEELSDKIKPPFFVFNDDGSVDTNKQHEEFRKDI